MSRLKHHVIFRQVGYYVMLDNWTKSANYMLTIDCRPLGGLKCGHAHVSTLSFEIRKNSRTLLVNPGYLHGFENGSRLLQSSLAHNSLSIDGESSSVSRWVRTRGREKRSGKSYSNGPASPNPIFSVAPPGASQVTHRRDIRFQKSDSGDHQSTRWKAMGRASTRCLFILLIQRSREFNNRRRTRSDSRAPAR